MQYIEEFQKLINMVTDMAENEAIHKFVYGLKPRVREMVQLANPTKLNDAMATAMNVDEITYRQYPNAKYAYRRPY